MVKVNVLRPSRDSVPFGDMHLHQVHDLFGFVGEHMVHHCNYISNFLVKSRRIQLYAKLFSYIYLYVFYAGFLKEFILRFPLASR